ncbi:MAG: protein kinase [Acidobacteriota bacterium]
MAEHPDHTPQNAPPEGAAPSNTSGGMTVAPSGSAHPLPAPVSGALSGTTVDHFELLEKLGAGGFGEVYRARDTRLRRPVAIKVLPAAFAEDSARRERFRREALAASALNHPHICTVHDLVESGGKYFLVMELVDGKTLRAALAGGPLALVEIVPIAVQMADALSEAHRAGIVHRDIKPGNIALTSRGQVKVLDFGLAKIIEAEANAEGSTLEKLTADGTTPGTLAYMSPEQLLGRHLDQRSDLFSLGVVLYEMATGKLPFQGSGTLDVADAILHAEPRTIAGRPIPDTLQPIIQKLLHKEPAKRYASAEELRVELAALQASLGPVRTVGLSRAAWVGIAAGLILLVAAAGWYLRSSSRERWALSQVPEINRLVESGDFVNAVALLNQSRAVLPKDPALEKLWLLATAEFTVVTNPPGADASIRPLESGEDVWRNLGQTPIQKVRIPRGRYVWRVTKPGFAMVTSITAAAAELKLKLLSASTVPAGMVPVLGGEVRLAQPLQSNPWQVVDDFLVDRTEVTNEEYKKFVDAGGYQHREYWKVPFVRDSRTLSWDEAMALLKDSTGRPGPSTWEVGSYPKGQERYPVAGVSWYEAAAYANFAGKRLPTAYHWGAAVRPDFVDWITKGSNFEGKAPQEVGRPGTLGGSGTVDAAGNVKEWCWNEAEDEKRVTLGGGFGEPSYMFINSDRQSPWNRQPNLGFRCMQLLSAPSPGWEAKLGVRSRDFLKAVPVSDDVFAAFRSQYRYDRSELDPKVEETTSVGDWTLERVTFNAAYASERMTVYVVIPKHASPPLQAVVRFHAAGPFSGGQFDFAGFVGPIGYFLESGRMMVLPAYKGTWDRPNGLKTGGVLTNPPAFWRDEMIMWSKDIGRTLDYLETRTDVDRSKIAYFGFSFGGAVAPVMLGIEQRFKAAVTMDGGIHGVVPLPEADPVNFAPRVRVPMLMLNGRLDVSFSVESSSTMFRLLGTPPGDKRQVFYDTTHGGIARKDEIRETLDWLDKYLGPVQRGTGSR